MYCMILCPGAVPDVVKPSSPSYATALRSPPSSKPSEEKERAAFARAVCFGERQWAARRARRASASVTTSVWAMAMAGSGSMHHDRPAAASAATDRDSATQESKTQPEGEAEARAAAAAARFFDEEPGHCAAALR